MAQQRAARERPTPAQGGALLTAPLPVCSKAAGRGRHRSCSRHEFACHCTAWHSICLHTDKFCMAPVAPLLSSTQLDPCVWVKALQLTLQPSLSPCSSATLQGDGRLPILPSPILGATEVLNPWLEESGLGGSASAGAGMTGHCSSQLTGEPMGLGLATLPQHFLCLAGGSASDPLQIGNFAGWPDLATRLLQDNEELRVRGPWGAAEAACCPEVPEASEAGQRRETCLYPAVVPAVDAPMSAVLPGLLEGNAALREALRAQGGPGEPRDQMLLVALPTYTLQLCVQEANMAAQGRCKAAATCMLCCSFMGSLLGWVSAEVLGMVKRLCTLMGRANCFACRCMWVLDFDPGWPRCDVAWLGGCAWDSSAWDPGLGQPGPLSSPRRPHCLFSSGLCPGPSSDPTGKSALHAAYLRRWPAAYGAPASSVLLQQVMTAAERML